MHMFFSQLFQRWGIFEEVLQAVSPIKCLNPRVCWGARKREESPFFLIEGFGVPKTLRF